jgi:hypothetical protein
MTVKEAAAYFKKLEEEGNGDLEVFYKDTEWGELFESQVPKVETLTLVEDTSSVPSSFGVYKTPDNYQLAINGMFEDRVRVVIT